MGLHGGRIGRNQHFVGPQLLGCGLLVLVAGDGRNRGAQRPRNLHGHVAQPANAHHGHLLAGAHVEVLHRRVRGHAGAQNRGRRLDIEALRNAQHEGFLHRHVGRIPAEGVEILVGGLHVAVVSGRPAHGAFAVVFLLLLARWAHAARVNHAAHAHHIAHPELGYGAAHLADAADHLVAGHAGINRVVPVIFHLVQVRMAHAAVENIDVHLVGLGGLAFDFHFRQATKNGIRSAVGFGFSYVHERVLEKGG